MGSFTVFVALTWMASFSQAAPLTEFFGSPQVTIEDDSNLDYPNPEQFTKVEEMERFHRTYKNGTVEFKMALSNGHVQYQRISSKIVDGDRVQVFEGYISEQYKDGRYGTRYYAADENGYRSSPVIVENEPPKLPSNGPYSANLPRDIQNQLSTLNEDTDTETAKTKTLLDNSVDLEEEQLPNLNQGSNFVNENSIPTTEPEIVQNLEKDQEILKHSEEPSTPNFNEVQTEISLNLDLTPSTEFPSTSEAENNNGEVSEEPAIPALEKGSNIDVASESSTEQPINDATTEKDKLEESSNLSILDDEQSVKKDLSGRIFPPSSEVLGEEIEDVKVSYEEPIAIVPTLEVSTQQPIDELPKASSETLLNEEVTLTEESSTQAPEAITEVPEINEVKIGGETSRSLKYPLEDSDTETTTVLTVDNISTNSAEEEETKVQTEQPSLEINDNQPINSIPIETETKSNSNLHPSSLASENENKNTEVNELNSGEIKSEEITASIAEITPNLEISTEKSFDEVSDATTTGQLLNDEVTSTEQSSSFNNEAQETITEVPETNELKIDDKTSRNLRFPLEDSESETTVENISNSSAEEEEELTKVLTEQPLLEVIEDKSTESIAVSENESNSDISTLSPAFEIETKTKEINELPTETSNIDEISTDLPLEASTNSDIEASGELPNDQDSSSSDKEGRSLDILKVLPLAENNSTSTVEGSGSKTNDEEADISSTSINLKTNEETTDKLELSTEQPQSPEEVSISTTGSDDASTEAEIISSTTQTDDLETSSSEKSEDNITEKGNQFKKYPTPLLLDSEEISNEETKEESKEDSIEDHERTLFPVESNEEQHITATNIEHSTESEVLSTTDETEPKSSVVEVEFDPPVINF